MGARLRSLDFCLGIRHFVHPVFLFFNILCQYLLQKFNLKKLFYFT